GVVAAPSARRTISEVAWASVVTAMFSAGTAAPVVTARATSWHIAAAAGTPASVHAPRKRGLDTILRMLMRELQAATPARPGPKRPCWRSPRQRQTWETLREVRPCWNRLPCGRSPPPSRDPLILELGVVHTPLLPASPCGCSSAVEPTHDTRTRLERCSG